MPEPREKEEHPSFGWARVNRLSSGPPGRTLFDSELRHQHFVRLEISRASRERGLNRDWIHGEIRPLIEIDMSMAQWGALVSAFGSEGVPVTLNAVGGEDMGDPPYEPRMNRSLAEIEESTDKVFGEVQDATEALREAFDRKAGRREMQQLLWDLEVRLKNAKPNTKFVAESLVEHVENVVTKARFDIEAAVRMAAERGLDAGDAVQALMVGDGDE